MLEGFSGRVDLVRAKWKPAGETETERIPSERSFTFDRSMEPCDEDPAGFSECKR